MDEVTIMSDGSVWQQWYEWILDDDSDDVVAVGYLIVILESKRKEIV